MALKTGLLVNILGQEYRIIFSDVTDPRLEAADGYCDFTTKQIVIRSESGLDNNSWGGNEEIVDWIALQLVKIVDVVNKIDIELRRNQSDV